MLVGHRVQSQRTARARASLHLFHWKLPYHYRCVRHSLLATSKSHARLGWYGGWRTVYNVGGVDADP